MSYMRLILGVTLSVGLCASVQAGPIVYDFETDDNAAAIGNGQKIDDEYFTVFTLTSDAGADHLGVTAFDSSDPGPNDSGADPDLLVNLGNVLILQNPNFPDGDADFFDEPNDFAGSNDEGTFTFSFVNPVVLTSIDLVDINGGVLVDVVLTDGLGRERTYDVPSMWTRDIDASGPDGYDTLFLNTLANQPGEAGGVATASEDAGFDASDVAELTVRIHGSSPSGAIDNLVIDQIIPEPTTLALMGAGAVALLARRRR